MTDHYRNKKNTLKFHSWKTTTKLIKFNTLEKIQTRFVSLAHYKLIRIEGRTFVLNMKNRNYLHYWLVNPIWCFLIKVTLPHGLKHSQHFTFKVLPLRLSRCRLYVELCSFAAVRTEGKAQDSRQSPHHCWIEFTAGVRGLHINHSVLLLLQQNIRIFQLKYLR